MWTPTTRAPHSRAGLRHGSDLTDAEWTVLEPLLPPPCDRGTPRRWPLREVVNAILHVLRGSCPWRMLPKDLPPWRTAYRWFARLRDAGTWENLNFALEQSSAFSVVMAGRERSGRSPGPSAAMPAQTCGFAWTAKACARPRAAARAATTRARRCGAASAMLSPMQMGARWCCKQDLLLCRTATVRCRCSGRRAAFTHSSSTPSPTATTPASAWRLPRSSPSGSCASRPGNAASPSSPGAGSSGGPSWLGRNRRLARDFEATIASATAFLHAAFVALLTQRLGRCT